MHATDPVNRLMTTPVLTISPEDPVKKALELFLSHPVHHLPVVDRDMRVVGMVSSADAMKLQFFMPASAKAVVERQWHVAQIMQHPVTVVTEHEPMDRCIEIMASKGIHSLPVVDRDAKLIGILTTTDVMRCSLQRSGEDLPGAPVLTEDRVANAVASARRAINSNHDPYHIAATLLHTQQRIAAMQTVVTAAKRYLNAGQEERLHVALAKALERADRFDEATRHPTVLGLS